MHAEGIGSNYCPPSALDMLPTLLIGIEYMYFVVCV